MSCRALLLLLLLLLLFIFTNFGFITTTTPTTTSVIIINTIIVVVDVIKVPDCFCLHGNLIRSTVLLVWYERALTLQGLVEEHQDLAVELGGADAVVVPIKEHELLVRAAIPGNQLL